jgi:hypothetical protein
MFINQKLSHLVEINSGLQPETVAVKLKYKLSRAFSAKVV